MARIPKGRANTTAKKVTVIAVLLRAWLKSPDLRLGQLISNMLQSNVDLFYVEDEVLAEWAKLHVLRYSKK